LWTLFRKAGFRICRISEPVWRSLHKLLGWKPAGSVEAVNDVQRWKKGVLFALQQWLTFADGTVALRMANSYDRQLLECCSKPVLYRNSSKQQRKPVAIKLVYSAKIVFSPKPDTAVTSYFSSALELFFFSFGLRFSSSFPAVSGSLSTACACVCLCVCGVCVCVCVCVFVCLSCYASERCEAIQNVWLAPRTLAHSELEIVSFRNVIVT
jgi:hypothetical protein